ncbi:E3 ubiquitin-protein ligase SHPRH isoform X2 [Diorhabda carinulata]|uniref:E3 ubiquitin-protein ligase SHPRH isoform X2 n=1 Tax=Diorhabda carinulata TaxID=1163345 RepID=UPI0025A16B14|nr:E3 ubiquitin-protein ligase SHPRH isoform X2 [Diorhabda carinulata]
MGRQKNTPKKNEIIEVDRRCLDYIPVVTKRKWRNTSKREKTYNILAPTNPKYYLGNLFVGQTNNIFPEKYTTVKISFNFAKNDSENLESCDNIILLCGTTSVIIRSCSDTVFLKDLVSYGKSFFFEFVPCNENVWLKVYLRTLPLEKFYLKLGNCLKRLFLMLYGERCSAKYAIENIEKFHGTNKIKLMYSQLIENRKSNEKNENMEAVQHLQLKPKLRPYQEESVRWMLQRERKSISYTDELHPLYIPIKLESGLEIYFDKYTGYVTSEKPVISTTSRGGILADEMGLGKTVEVLACILMNPKCPDKLEELTCDLEDMPIVRKTPKKRNCIIDSDDELSSENTSLINKLKDTEERVSEKEEAIIPIVKLQRKKRKMVIETKKTDYTHKPKPLKIPKDFVQPESKKSATFLALDMWYKNILSEISTVKPESYEDPNKKSVQCICGSISEERIIKCSNCIKYQHIECLGYKKSLGKYICPQCWMEEPLIESKATLIVTPTALKTQWKKEICKHIIGNFKVLQYQGFSATPVYPTELKEYDVVLTTYNVLQNELRLTENGQEFNLRKARKYLTPGSPLTRLKWWRLCLDEAQTVETPGRMVSAMARKIEAFYRWAITGTPISKNISDLQGLIDYLQINPYSDITVWNKILYEPYLAGNEQPLLNFLSDVLWRTAKKDVTNQINIPQQTYLEHLLEFSAVEKYFYKREHELICNDFLSKVRKYDLSIHLESLDKSTLKKLLAPLLTLRHACTHPNTVRGRYLATKKQVTSMKDLLNALILKNTNDSEDCLRLIISAYNGLAGIHILENSHQEAINNYRQVLQLVARFSGDKCEAKLTIDKPQVIHTLYNLAEIISIYPPEQPTLRDENLKTDCIELERKYMEKFISDSTSAFESFSAIMLEIEKMQNQFSLKDGQWYSDGLDWLFLNGHYNELLNKIHMACENAGVPNNLRNNDERQLLRSMCVWDDEIFELRSKLFEAVELLYDNHPESVHKIIIKQDLVTQAMNCHLRPQKKSRQANKCSVCVANDHLKKYEIKLFCMTKREKTFEEMSLVGSWKPTLQELVFRAIHSALRSKHAKTEYVKDGELHINIIENLKKEFKELRRLWTFLDQQICARDELDICKVRLQLKTDTEIQKTDKTLKNLTYELENKNETINLLSVHELDYQMSLLENEVRQNTAKLEKLLGTQSYLETLRKQQYEGQSPDPCPICKNTLEQHWSILLCGHSYCLECIQVLLEQTAGDHIQCSVCRNKQKYQEISYIKAGTTVTDDDCKKIKGNYSTKIEGVIKVLLDLKRDDTDVKVLLFSSWFTVLKCLKEALIKNNISCELANTGTLDVKITNFKDPLKKIMVLLLPVNLGSKGLNLIEATHVILVEPLLNPADELQAIGRINRIGQTKKTYVHKFLIKNTIEENIHQATTSNAEKWEKSSVTLRHLVDLFNTTDLNDETIEDTQMTEVTLEHSTENSIDSTLESAEEDEIEENDNTVVFA